MISRHGAGAPIPTNDSLPEPGDRNDEWCVAARRAPERGDRNDEWCVADRRAPEPGDRNDEWCVADRRAPEPGEGAPTANIKETPNG